MQFNKCFGRDVIQCESIIYSGTFWYVCTCWPEITFRTLSKERFFKTSHYTRTLHFTLKRYRNSEGENSFQEKQCLLRKKIIYLFIKKILIEKIFFWPEFKCNKIDPIFSSTNFALLRRLSPATILSKVILLQVPVNIKGTDSQEVHVYGTANIGIKEA